MEKIITLYIWLAVLIVGEYPAFARSACQEWDIDCLLRDDTYFDDKQEEIVTRKELLVDQDLNYNGDEQHEESRLLQRTAVGTLNVLVLPISWSDRPDDRTLPTIEQLDELWNGVGEGENYPSGSISNWTNVNSYGNFVLNAIIAPYWIEADNTEIYYANGNSGKPKDDANATQVHDAINYALEQLENEGFDFSPFDQDNDGVLDAVAVLHSGYSAEVGLDDCSNGRGYLDRIHSRQGSAPEDSGWSGPNGVRLGLYTISSTFIGACNAKLARLGTTVHEFIHLFGFPELYDVEQAFESSTGNVGGVGGFDPMYVGFQQFWAVVCLVSLSNSPVHFMRRSLISF